MVFFNTDYRKQRESVTNQISNKAKKKKNTNQNLEIEGLINLRKLYTSDSIVDYFNINSLKNIKGSLQKDHN